MNRIDRTIAELAELSSITEIEPIDVAALEAEQENPLRGVIEAMRSVFGKPEVK